MSRIGRLPIELPDGVSANIDDANNTLTVKGPKGELSKKLHESIKATIENSTVTVERISDTKFDKSLHGLTRSLIDNMVVGVTKGFERVLEIEGVGYRAQKQGKKLILNVGYSHPVEIEEEPGIEFDVPAPNKIIIRGIDKQKVGAVASAIRSIREPEPYNGKGIKFEGERIIRKEGKTG